MGIKKIITPIILLFFLGGYLLSTMWLKNERIVVQTYQRAEALMVSPVLLEIVAGEFKGLLADYLLLKASAFLGSRYQTTEDDYDAVQALLNQSLTLDPYFYQTCYYVQAFLAWQGKRIDEAIELLKISEKFRYWDWTPGFYIGFDYFYFLKDNRTASEYLLKTSKKQDAPPILATLGARLAQKSGNTMTAIAFLKSMLPTVEDDTTHRQVELRIEALEGVVILEKGISEFQARFGELPKNLEALISSGILKQLPVNPYNKPFTYEDGIIGF